MTEQEWDEACRLAEVLARYSPRVASLQKRAERLRDLVFRAREESR